jgi:hypothetical protein
MWDQLFELGFTWKSENLKLMACLNAKKCGNLKNNRILKMKRMLLECLLRVEKRRRGRDGGLSSRRQRLLATRAGQLVYTKIISIFLATSCLYRKSPEEYKKNLC